MTKSRLSPEMEGSVARHYARIRGTESQLASWRADADRLIARAQAVRPTTPAETDRATAPAATSRSAVPAETGRAAVPAGTGRATTPADAGRATTTAAADRAADRERTGRAVDILEVAPGPGYLTVELARRGARVSALDISRTFTEMVGERAAAAGVPVDARHGDASAMPFPDGGFDLIICQAAFKNFLRPVEALDEMHRVLRPGGVALIEDLRRDATRAQIAQEVAGMRLHRTAALFTRVTLGWLRGRAHTEAQLRALASRSAFRDAATERYGTIGLRLILVKETA